MRGRRQLGLMFGIAAGGLLGAYLLLTLALERGLWGTTNQGEFVVPALVIDQLRPRDSQGRPFATDGHWWVWVVGDVCEQACVAAAEGVALVRLRLHKDAPRVRQALLVAQPLEQWLPPMELPAYQGTLGVLTPGVYIVDPLGNVVLRYSHEQVGKPLLEDLKHLLKVSQIG